MKVDYIIVGLGLAGLAFIEYLKEEGKSFMVYEDNSQSSSLVAGGTYNPVILKRYTQVWNAHEQLKVALPFYNRLEDRFKDSFDEKFKALKIFKSVGDQNKWFSALDKPIISSYMKDDIIKGTIPGVIGDFGFGELTGNGRIDTTKLVFKYRQDLKRTNSLLEEVFDYNGLIISDSELGYKGVKANKIVFCEGFGLKKNPFFNYLPLNGTKGETITIHAPDLKLDSLLKSSVFVLPLGDDLYKVGATFNREDKTSLITKEGRVELEEKLQKVISVPYTITEQAAGIRPTVIDRRPLAGIHTKHSNLAVLNGFGTRGVMIAPTVAKQLLDYLERGIALDKEVDIKRF